MLMFQGQVVVIFFKFFQVHSSNVYHIHKMINLKVVHDSISAKQRSHVIVSNCYSVFPHKKIHKSKPIQQLYEYNSLFPPSFPKFR